MATDTDSNLAVKERIKVQKPPLYVVILHNDDYTTMEFVIEILVTVFQKDQDQAFQIMLDVHKKGTGVCGVYSREVAETKVNLVHQKAAEASFPLKCSMQKE